MTDNRTPAQRAADDEFPESILAPENEQRADDFEAGFNRATTPIIHLPESDTLASEGYYSVELGGQRFTKEQWEAVQLYAKGYADSCEIDEAVATPGHRAQRQVTEFHTAMGQPAPLDGPRPLPAERVAVRIELIREEFIDELIPALGMRVVLTPDGKMEWLGTHGEQNVVEVADAAIDILYVTYGLLVEMGIDAMPLFEEVQASNMSKLGEDGKPIIAGPNDPDGIFPGRVKKGPNYFKPDLARILSEQAMRAGAEEDPLAYAFYPNGRYATESIEDH